MSARSRTTSMEQMVPSQKRQRAGSISSRLRAASDLEEHGFIDKYQKGVFKDLIISGDSAMQSALDRYEQQGDASEIKALIAGSSGRRQSIDLLDGLDLDFLNVKKNFGGSFDGDLFFDELGDDANDPFKLFSTDDTPAPAPRGPGIAVSGSRGRAASGHFQPGMMDGGGQVDMSEYDAVAASLQNFQSQQGQDPMLSNMAYYMNNRERTNSGIFGEHGGRERMGSFAMDGGRERMGSFAMDGRDRGNSTSSLFEGSRGRFDSTASIGSFGGQGAQSATTGGPVGVRREMDLHQPSGVGPVASAYGMNQQQHTSAFSDYFSEHPQYADGDMHDGEGREKYVGIYSPEARRKRIEKFLEKRKRRVWTKKVKYDVRKNFADSRLRVKGRFVKKEDEETLRELLEI